MKITETMEPSRGKMTTHLPSIQISPNVRTTLLFAAAFVFGAAGWSGKPSLNFMALLYPFVYLQSRRRLDALSSALYYAGATWSVIPGSESFFGTGGNLLLPLLICVALLALSAAPWIAFYNRAFLPVSAVAAFIVLSLPPFSLVTVAHPLISVGEWFPGTRWFGLCLPLVLILAYRRFGIPLTTAVLVGASLAAHARFHRPPQDPHIVAVNTRFGGPATRDILSSTLQGQETAMQRIALTYPDSLVLFPESIIPTWNPTHDERWASTFAQLQARHTGLLIGTTIPVANTQANRNVLLSRGYTERLSYVQRVPVPLGMWHFGDERNGFPLMLHYPATIRIWDHRAGVLICYEQLLVWPALETLARNPDMLLAPSNLYWASGTIIPSVQHVSAQNWADLWAIPLYEASNR
jgi:hypothetical protein